MPERLETQVAQAGASVSGGQRQRLAIARALAKKACIYIFDDSFSAVDVKTDADLRAALRRETAQATTIVVAQRVGTIMNAQQIVVLEDGGVVGLGTHDELLQSCETYREIVTSRLGTGALEGFADQIGEDLAGAGGAPTGDEVVAPVAPTPPDAFAGELPSSSRDEEQ